MLEGDVPANQVPSEMVTASGAGLDPHIPPAAADLQAPRVARGARRHRSIACASWFARIPKPPTFGFLGRARVNVLELNLALDESLGRVTHAARAPARLRVS